MKNVIFQTLHLSEKLNSEQKKSRTPVVILLNLGQSKNVKTFREKNVSDFSRLFFKIIPLNENMHFSRFTRFFGVFAIAHRLNRFGSCCAHRNYFSASKKDQNSAWGAVNFDKFVFPYNFEHP